MADTRTDDEKVKDITQRLSMLEEVRRPYETLWDEIIELVAHGRRPVGVVPQEGGKTGMAVYDGTAVSALSLLCDGLHGYLVSPAIRWFSLTLPNKVAMPRFSSARSLNGKRLDEVPQVKRWLEETEEVMYAAYLRSNFYEITPEFFRDGASIGTATIYREEDIKAGRIMYANPHPREIYIAEDHYGKVDTVYRKVSYTYRQLEDKFGSEVMQRAVIGWIDKLQKTPYATLTVIHAVYPRTDFDSKKADSKNKPWASMWVLQEGNKLLRESGYDNLPHAVWRYRKNSDEWYGRSPASDAIVDIYTANQMAKSQLAVTAMIQDPPYLAHRDLRGKLNIGPKGRTWVDRMDQAPVSLLPNMSGFPLTLEHQERIKRIIEGHFHVDFFLMLSRAAFERVDLTATQVIEMQGEKAAILGTRIGKLQSEFLNPDIDWVFTNELRAGRIPPMPDILTEYAGANIEVDYLGPLAQAQKRLFKTQSLRAGLESLAPLVSVFPQVVDVLNPDETARQILENHGFPTKCIRAEEDLQAVRQQRQEEAKIAAMSQAIPDMAKAIPAAGKAPEEGSILAQIMGQANG